MQYVEVTNSKQSLLLLTHAVVQLIQASTAIDKNQMFIREVGFLTYQKTKQTELLNQLYEVIQSRKSTLSTYEQHAPTVPISNELDSLESSVGNLIKDLLDLYGTQTFPKEEYILSIERLQSKWLPVLPKQEVELSNDHLPKVKVRSKELTTSVIDPILHWSKNETKKTTKQKINKNIKDEQPY